MLWLVLLLVPGPFAARASYKQRPTPRCKPGESKAEGHIMLLGAFRIYSWLIWINVVNFALSFVTMHSPVLLVVRLVAVIALLMAARALYWRLGYDRWLAVMVLGHLTGAFALSEYFYGLRHDLSAYLTNYERSQTSKA